MSQKVLNGIHDGMTDTICNTPPHNSETILPRDKMSDIQQELSCRKVK